MWMSLGLIVLPSTPNPGTAGRTLGILARAKNTTQAEGHPLARPHYAGSLILWLQHDPFPSQPMCVRAASDLASGAVIHFHHWPKLRTQCNPYRLKLT